MPGRHKILVVDDNEFNRQGLCLYLERQEFETLEASDESTAWRLVETHQPSAVVLDIVIPTQEAGKAQSKHSRGVHLATQIKQSYPATGVVLFSAYEDRGELIFDLVHQGVRGIAYMLKGCTPKDLLDALQKVLAGKVLIDSEVTNTRLLVDDLLVHLTAMEKPWVLHASFMLKNLTPREREVAERLAAAHNTKSIAKELTIELKTVENYISRIYSKLGFTEMVSEAPALRQIVILAKAFLVAELQLTAEGERHDEN